MKRLFVIAKKGVQIEIKKLMLERGKRDAGKKYVTR